MSFESGRTVWSLLTGADDQWRCWDDEVVLRIAVTGDTHHLGPVATGIFQLLRSNPHGLGLRELAEHFASVGSDDPSALRDAVEGALLELERIGVAQRLDVTSH